MKNTRVKIPIFLLISVFTFLLIGSFVLLSPANAAESGCVKCHTSENLLKTLHKPSKVVVSEGEG